MMDFILIYELNKKWNSWKSPKTYFGLFSVNKSAGNFDF